MVKIIGLSGKKGSGKSWLARFLKENSKTIFGDEVTVVIKPLAEPLKRLCVEILGLRPEQVYGTDDEKNTLTRYLWEDLPHYMEIVADNPTNAPRGAMTARQVVQEIGTGVFRRMYSAVWTDACIRGIKESGADIGIIDDVRFPNEVDAIHEACGLVFRIPRDLSNNTDKHASETSLNPDIFDWNRFDHIIGKSTDDYGETTKKMLDILPFCCLLKPLGFDDLHRMGL